MPPQIALIGGSGLYRLDDEPLPPQTVQTPYHPEPIAVRRCTLGGHSLYFLPRHGEGHQLPPHRIPYRANIWALKEVGVHTVLAINACGGISESNPPGQLVVPDQIIDYTWGRDHSFFDGLGGLHDHVDFTEPYSQRWREQLIKAGRDCGLPVTPEGVYACTQGPRLETAAEIRRLARDGATLVGMTGMPEAALARELGLEYASLALIVNWAAGLSTDTISIDTLKSCLDEGMTKVRQVLLQLLDAQ